MLRAGLVLWGPVVRSLRRRDPLPAPGRTELRRFHAYNSARFRHYDNLYYQYRNGTLEPSQWKGLGNLLASHLAEPGIEKWWDSNDTFFSDEFVSHVNRLREEGQANAQSQEKHEAIHGPW